MTHYGSTAYCAGCKLKAREEDRDIPHMTTNLLIEHRHHKYWCACSGSGQTTLLQNVLCNPRRNLAKPGAWIAISVVWYCSQADIHLSSCKACDAAIMHAPVLESWRSRHAWAYCRPMLFTSGPLATLTRTAGATPSDGACSSLTSNGLLPAKGLTGLIAGKLSFTA